MAYSNTNKDKAQAKSKYSIINILAVLLAIFFIISSISGIWRQIALLNKAETDLVEIKDNIETTRKENLRLVEEIREATTSMGMKRNMAKYFGLGAENDYWLKIPKQEEEKETVIDFDDQTVKDDEDNLTKWWQLFFE